MDVSISHLPKGQQLRVIRVARNLRILDVAVALGVQPARISEAERGVTTAPDVLQRIEEYLTA